MESLLILVVLQFSIIALQQVYYLRQIQKLVDKVMSRSYTEYVRAKEPIQKPMIQLEDTDNDLETLQAISS